MLQYSAQVSLAFAVANDSPSLRRNTSLPLPISVKLLSPANTKPKAWPPGRSPSRYCSCASVDHVQPSPMSSNPELVDESAVLISMLVTVNCLCGIQMTPPPSVL